MPRRPPRSTPLPPTTPFRSSFTFTAPEAGSSFACRLDGGAFAPCVSPRSYSALGFGDHNFEVRATDAAGNTDPTPASYAWTVGIRAPSRSASQAPAQPGQQGASPATREHAA